MALFDFKKEEKETNYGSPLFAAALAGKAGLAYPASEKLVSKLRKNITDLEMDMIREGTELTPQGLNLLKSKLLDKNLRDLPVLTKNDVFFQKVKKDWLPAKADFMKAMDRGGFTGVSGSKLDPLKVVKDARRTGGFVGMTHSTPASVAHELGHATMLNRASKIRGSKLYDVIEMASRNSATRRNAAIAALLAGGFDSDDNRKWAVPALVAATQAPVLAEEGIASYKALTALKDIAKTNPEVMSKEVLKKVGPYLRRAFGTYGLASAGMLAAPLAAIGAREYYDDWLKD